MSELDEYIKKTKALIANTKDWNDGMGLIVPPALAKELKKHGIDSGYSIFQPIPTK